MKHENERGKPSLVSRIGLLLVCLMTAVLAACSQPDDPIDSRPMTSADFEAAGFSKVQSELVANASANGPVSTRRLQLLEAQRQANYPSSPLTAKWKWNDVEYSTEWKFDEKGSFISAKIDRLDEIRISDLGAAVMKGTFDFVPSSMSSVALMETVQEAVESQIPKSRTIDGFSVTVEPGESLRLTIHSE